MISLQNLLLWSTIFLTTEPHHTTQKATLKFMVAGLVLVMAL